jgi:hypothetical protein
MARTGAASVDSQHFAQQIKNTARTATAAAQFVFVENSNFFIAAQ